jgi:ATP-dependent Zn protease
MKHLNELRPFAHDFPPLDDDAPEQAEHVEHTDAISATIDAVMRSQLAGVIPRLRSGEPLCLLVVPASADWCGPLGEALEKKLRRRGRAAPFGEASHVIVRREPPRSSSRDEDGLRLVKRLSQGKAVIGISHAPEACLPPALLRAADITLRLPHLTGRALRKIVSRVTGQDPGRIPDELAGSVSLDDIATCVRPGGGGKRAVERLEATRAARARTRSVAVPPLEALSGYGEAKGWGLSLVREVARYRAGQIGLVDLPRGLLLSGPPGCGKTLFAQALARSAGLPILATSAANWISSGDGLGDAIKAMRQDFEAARELKPAILFVDEADALVDPAHDGGNGRSWWLSFRAALLAAVDGAATEPGIILLGACNHPHLVDAALRRAGRLDRHIALAPPSPAELTEILRTQLAGELAGEDLAPLGHLAAGSSGAEVARAVREARAMARDAGRALRLADLRAAIAPRETRPASLLRLVALHEAGHAVAAHRLGRRVAHVSLLPRGDTGGHAAISEPQRLSRATLEETVVILLAGRAADTLLGAGACAGACSDLAHATRLLAQAQTALGLGDTLLAVDAAHVERLLLEDAALRALIATELDDLWQRTLALVGTHRHLITALAEALVRERLIATQRLEKILDSAVKHSAKEGPTATGAAVP